MTEQSLKDKTVKGVGWSAMDNIAGHSVTFIVSVVLAHQYVFIKNPKHLEV